MPTHDNNPSVELMVEERETGAAEQMQNQMLQEAVDALVTPEGNELFIREDYGFTGEGANRRETYALDFMSDPVKVYKWNPDQGAYQHDTTKELHPTSGEIVDVGSGGQAVAAPQSPRRAPTPNFSDESEDQGAGGGGGVTKTGGSTVDLTNDEFYGEEAKRQRPDFAHKPDWSATLQAHLNSVPTPVRREIELSLSCDVNPEADFVFTHIKPQR